MPKRERKQKKPVVTKFKVGDKVRVKHGITDVEPVTTQYRMPTSTNTGRQRIGTRIGYEALFQLGEGQKNHKKDKMPLFQCPECGRQYSSRWPYAKRFLRTLLL